MAQLVQYGTFPLQNIGFLEGAYPIATELVTECSDCVIQLDVTEYNGHGQGVNLDVRPPRGAKSCRGQVSFMLLAFQERSQLQVAYLQLCIPTVSRWSPL